MLVAASALLGLLPAAAQAASATKVKIQRSPGFVTKYHPGNGITAPTHADTPQELQVDLVQQVQASRFGVPETSAFGTQQFLPTTWCGTERTTDDTADSAQPPNAAYYKVVYAYAHDQPDRFNTWKNQLQANVSLIGQFMSQQDGATKAPRFDMGTSCGPRYLDIQTVALPGNRAFYADQFTRIKTDVGLALGTMTTKRNVMILADSLTVNGPTSLYGLGEHYNGGSSDIAGASNPHNDGNLYSALFPPVGYTPPTSAGQQFYPGFWPEGMLHEVSHTLGAVNYSAPHTSAGAEGPRGHCTDGYDVMCYADGANPTVPYTTTACPQIAGGAGMNQTYDCGGDDYFNPNPTGTNYLVTHWNLYNSIFEGDCSTLGDACGVSAPVLQSDPAVSGTAKRTHTLSASHGAWSDNPTSYGYQWQRSGGGSFTDIAGETGADHVLTADDVGESIRVQVTATNANGSSAPASSLPVGPVADLQPPVISGQPTITGTARNGQYLSADHGTWSNSPTGYAYQWQRDTGGGFADIPSNASQVTYLLTPADVGAIVRVRVAASNADGAAGAVDSDPTATVADAPVPSNSGAPVISGVAKRGSVLDAAAGDWNNTPTSYTYQWQRQAGSDFSDIAGAVASTYTPVAGDVGLTLRVLVAATNSDGSSPPSPSAATAPVGDVPASTTAPSVTGGAQNGSTLTSSPGSWTNSPSSHAYRWQVESGGSWLDIASATTSTYQPTAAAIGHRLRSQVTATNAFGDGVATSAPTASVTDAPAPPAAQAPAPEPAATPAKAATPTPAPTPAATVKPLLTSAVITLKSGTRALFAVPVTATISPAGVVAKVTAKKVKLAKGRYKLKLCIGSVCGSRSFTAKGGKAKLPAIVVQSPKQGRITVTLTGKGFTAKGVAK